MIQYPEFNYQLDTYVDTSGGWLPWNWADTAGKGAQMALMDFINTLWGINVTFSSIVRKLIQSAFNLDFITDNVSKIQTTIQEVAGFNGSFQNTGIYSQLMPLLFLFVGAWCIYVGMLKREGSRFAQGIISSVLMAALALGYAYNAAEMLNKINDFSKGLQDAVLSPAAHALAPDSANNTDPVKTIDDQIYSLTVYRPYLLLQYGSTDENVIKAKGKDRIDNILKLDPVVNGADREQLVKNEVTNESLKNMAMSVGGITKRAETVPIICLFTFILGIGLLFISGLILLYSLLFLVIAVIGPFALLISIVPAWSFSARKWFSKLLYTLLFKVGIAALLTLVFTMCNVFISWKSDDASTYFGNMILMIALLIGVFLKRKYIGEIFLIPVKATQIHFPYYQRVSGTVKKIHTKTKHYINIIGSKGVPQDKIGLAKRDVAKSPTASTNPAIVKREVPVKKEA